MPALVGRSREAAERWIEQAGFRRGPVRVIPTAEQRAGTVVGQLPLAGYPIDRRGVVELTVAE
jgi:beta-lactam-binding protein with PASTA domain